MIDGLQQYGPTQPVSVLVAELNQLYHEHEAANYETTHPEIFDQLPPLWREMIGQVDLLRPHSAASYPSLGRLRILDFGCGTGFEAVQCLLAFGAERIERLVCYDCSPRMLDRCRRSLNSAGCQIEFLEDLASLDAAAGEFNLLLTNSVLHHLVDPVGALREISPLISRDAFWLCGHEPSSRFLANSDCASELRRYRARDRWRRLLSVRRCSRRMLRWAGFTELPEDYAARRAFERSMFEHRPPGAVVSRLVDYHVVTSANNMEETRGLDFRSLQDAFAGEWDLTWRRTYSFFGPHYEGRLPRRWREEARRLAGAYPDDGANFCVVWRRGIAAGGLRDCF